MSHPIYRVTQFEIVGQYSLHVEFDDGLAREIDFEPVLAGELFGPLRDPEQFSRVALDPEVHTLVWPSGADFDPRTLHDWPEMLPELRRMAERWERSATSSHVQ